MATTTKSVMVTGVITERGLRLNGSNGSLYEYSDTFGNSYQRSSETVVSYNSPPQWRKVKEYVVFIPRSGKTPTLPSKPTFVRPFAPSLRPRGPKQSAASWKRALAKHGARLRAFEAKVVKLESRYNIRLAKYKVRLEKYEAYFRKVKNGVLKTVRKRNLGVSVEWHPYSKTQVFDTGTHGVYRLNQRWWIYGVPKVSYSNIAGDLSGYADAVVPSGLQSKINDLVTKASTAADSIALNRFHEKLSGEQVHLGQVLAERAQSYGLLVESMTRLLAFLKNFTPKRLIMAPLGYLSKKGSLNLANDILAFKFGVEPLMSDVKGSAEALAHLVNDDLTSIVHVRGSSVKSFSEVFTESVPIARGQILKEVTVQVYTRVSYVCEYGVDNLATRELSALGLINPAEILWELTPWSFVVDWVYPIGNYMRHLTNEVGLNFLRGTRATKTVVTTTTRYIRQEQEPYNPTYWGSEDWIYYDFTRTQGSISKVRTLLDRSPYVQAPLLKNPFSGTHVLEALALLRQKFKFK